MSRGALCFGMLTLAAGSWLAGEARAQEMRIYSEFRRVDPFGEILPQDRGGRPREILSPLLARNSHFTFRVVVEPPPGKHFYLYIGTYPEDIFEIKVYKEMWTRGEDGWTPDRLLPVKSPYLGHVPDPYHGLPNQKVESFLMDVYVPASVDWKRYKLEPQLSVNGHWLVYPMEVRVSDVIAPLERPVPARLPSASSPADAAVLSPLRAYLCGETETGHNGVDSGRWLIRRNTLEDLSIARRKEEETGMSREEMGNHLLRGLNMDVATFCAAEEVSKPSGPEWFLRARDFLYRGSQRIY